MLLICLTSCLLTGVTPPPLDTVTLFSNGYVYPRTDDEGGINSRHGIIDSAGLGRWDDPSYYSKTFFFPQCTGTLNVSIRLRSPSGGCRISVRLDSSGESHVLDISPGREWVTVPAGDFEIRDARYHCVEIHGLTKTGRFFPDVQAVLFSGVAASHLRYNNTEHKGAASVHLWYSTIRDSAIAWFYTEVRVPAGVNTRNAYYMTNGFRDGYMGIQVNSGTERRFIFSIWSNYDTNDPNQIPAEYAVRLVKKGEGVFTEPFGGEGSGGHSHLSFPWKNGVTYKLLVGAKAAGDHTLFTAYYYAPENGAWRLIAEWDKAKTGGKLLDGLYSFLESFGPNGDDYFKAFYGHQMARTPSGTWIGLSHATMTTTAGPRHPRFDYGAGTDGSWFYLYSGGFRDMMDPRPDVILDRAPGGETPDIDFLALPEK